VAAALVLGSFLLLIAVWFARSSNPAQPIATVMQDLSTGHPAALLLGTSTIVFNFSGWDNVSPYAGEVDRRQKNYPVAIAAALVLRARRPDAHRPFRIPGGRFGLWYVCLAPLIVAAAVLTAAVHDADSYGPQLLAIALVAVSGVALYLARRGHARKCRHDPQPQRIS
jgi:amino acid transporter